MAHELTEQERTEFARALSGLRELAQAALLSGNVPKMADGHGEKTEKDLPRTSARRNGGAA